MTIISKEILSPINKPSVIIDRYGKVLAFNQQFEFYIETKIHSDFDFFNEIKKKVRT